VFLSRRKAQSGEAIHSEGCIWCDLSPGLLQSRNPPLSHERSECAVELIGECASGLSNIGGSLSRKQPKDGVVENSEHLRGMAQTQLGMIFSQRGNTTD
jgi:hypothetical protein